MRGPLALVLSDGTTSWDVTVRTSGLRFKRRSDAGDVDLTCTVTIPRDLIRDPGPGWTLRVDDVRTCETVWSGDLTFPGVTDGKAGQSLDLQALGAGARLQAAKWGLGYVAADEAEWQRANSNKHVDTTQDEKGEGNETLEVRFNTTSIAVGDRGEWVFRGMKRNGLKVGRVRADVDCGITTSGYMVQLRTGTTDSDLTVRDSHTADTTAFTLRATLDGNIDGSDKVAALGVVRQGSSVTATKTHWMRFSDVVVRQVLKDKFGANITTGYTDNTVKASEVITDMIGRGMFPGVDPTKVTIANTSYDIDNLSWFDGITMGDALQELTTFERDLYWTAYGDSFTAGLWDEADPRHIFSKDDGGITHPGEERTLCNRVAVSWTDRKGKEHTTIVTANVPELGGDPAAVDFDGIIRDAEDVTLNPGTGSEGNANRAGAEALRLTNHPPKAGTAVIRRPVMDLWAGRLVLPHELMPGCVVVEQETGDLFRLTEVDYSDDDGAATCTLGTPVRTIAQRLARLRRKQRRRH